MGKSISDVYRKKMGSSMTISKKVLLVVFMSSIFSAYVQSTDYAARSNATLLEDVDMMALRKLVDETSKAFSRAAKEFEATRAGQDKKSKDYVKGLCAQQKEIVEHILKRLKKAYEQAKQQEDSSETTKKGLYRAYKALVYRAWKESGVLPSL